MSSDVSGGWAEAAAEIGSRIVDEAIWSADRCNWLGRVPDEIGSGGPAVHAALGVDLYSGTSGVGLFLAELYAATGDPATRQTALGALLLASERVDEVPPSQRWGLYTGSPGVVFALATAASLLDAPELVAAARHIVSELESAPVASEEAFDLIGGLSGGAVALLAATRMGVEVADHLLERLGERLETLAVAQHTGVAWRDPGEPANLPLTGLAHGASGPIGALAALAGAGYTPQAQWLTAAAADYEDAWWDEHAGSWADLRGFRRRPGRNASLAVGWAWCHGAPGIALVRHIYRDALGDRQAERVAAGVRAVRAAAEEALQSTARRYSLCHGLAGLGLALHQYGDSTAAARIADSATASSPGWRLLNGESDSPGLMLGRAGIGAFLLGLSRGMTASPLWPLAPLAPASRLETTPS